jgi:rhamnogalacturonyl hydrolase YesR
MNKLNLRTSTAAATTKKKNVSKLDDHVVKSGIDNEDKFLDPTTNVYYHKIKTLGKGGFAKGTLFKI